MRADWQQIRDKLRAEFGEAAFKSWLAPIELDTLDGTRAVISVPTRFMRDWVARHYLDRISHLLRDGDAGPQAVEIVVRGGVRAAAPGAVATDGMAASAGAGARGARRGAVSRAGG